MERRGGEREKRKSRLGKLKEKRMSYMPSSQKRRESTFSTTVLSREDGSLAPQQPIPFGSSGGKSKTTFAFPKAEASPIHSSVSCSNVILSEARPINYGVAQWDFQRTNDNETSMKKGDLVEILNEDDEDWLLIRLEDVEGYVPKKFIKIIVEPAPSPSPSSPLPASSSATSSLSSPSPTPLNGNRSPTSSSPSSSPGFPSSSSSPSVSSSSSLSVRSVPQDLSLLATAPGLSGEEEEKREKKGGIRQGGPGGGGEAFPGIRQGGPGGKGGGKGVEEDVIGDASKFLGEGADVQDVQRFKIAKEILTTEKSYHQSLSQLIDIYKVEFVHFSTDPNNELSQDSIKCIFSNVESIRALSENLSENLTNQMKNWTAVQTIGDIFIKIAPIMIIYTEYANGYEKGLNMFKDKRRRIKHLDHLHGECKKRAGFDLDHYLIMPIQRIPRYNLLLGDLLKNTKEDHPDHKNLSKGLAACQRIATNINDCMRQTEKFKEMSDLVEKNALFGSLLQANRQLKVQQHSLVTRISLIDGAFDGAVEKEREKEKEKAEREREREREKGLILIFNDLFVYATKKALGSVDPIANSFVVPLNLVWYKGSDGTSCDVVIPGFFLSIYPDDKKETNIRTKLSVAVEKNLLEHLKAFWIQTMENEYKILLEKAKEMKVVRKAHTEDKEKKEKYPGRVGEIITEKANLEQRLEIIDNNITTLKKMMQKPEENPVQILLGEIVGDLKKGMAGAGEDAVMRSQFEDRITVVLLIKKQVAKIKAKPKPQKTETPASLAKKMLIKFEEGKIVKDDLTTSFAYRYGRFTDSDKGDYEGWWRGGLPHRTGELKFQGNFYTGEFVNGFQQGKGVCVYFTGAKYEGRWEKNMANGPGIFISEDGDKYEGSFWNNLKQGKGEIIYKSGNKYSGEWKHDLPNGAGDLILACGLHYFGGFKDGLFEGEGVLISPIGKKYRGSWVGGMRQGKGIMQESDGASYAGEWHQNCFHGIGTYNNPTDGTFYCGEWVNGMKEGEGFQVYHNGDFYSGQFRMNTRIGRGCCEFSNEDYYIGQWKNDVFHGKGGWIKANGVKFQGNFVDGLYDGVVQTSTGGKTIKPSVASFPRFHTFQVEF